jgi:hypothetical protein
MRSVVTRRAPNDILNRGSSYLLHYLSRTRAELISAEWAFAVYCMLVEVFSARILKFPGDRVNAITGINQTLMPHLGFLTCGLFYNVIEYSLLWVRKSDGDPVRIHNFPSFSWAGWEGPIQYNLANHLFLMRSYIDIYNIRFSCRADYALAGDWKDVLELNNAEILSADRFHRGVGSSFEAADSGSRRDYAGILFDANFPEVLEGRIYLFVALVSAERPVTTFIIEALEAQVFRKLDEGQKAKMRQRTQQEEHMLVMLAEKNGEYIERVGLGQIRQDIWRNNAQRATEQIILM